jgi:hypothetical protein
MDPSIAPYTSPPEKIQEPFEMQRDPSSNVGENKNEVGQAQNTKWRMKNTVWLVREAQDARWVLLNRAPSLRIIIGSCSICTHREEP